MTDQPRVYNGDGRAHERYIEAEARILKAHDARWRNQWSRTEGPRWETIDGAALPEDSICEISDQLAAADETRKREESEWDRKVAEREIAERIAWRIRESGVPTRYQHVTLAGMDMTPEDVRAAVARARRYLDEREYKRGDWLYLSGCPGTGKTHIACAVGIEYVNATAGKKMLHFVSTPDLLEAIKRTFGRRDDERETADPLESAKDADCLVLDDIGTGKTSEWVRGILFMLIDYRYSAMKPTVITSNLSLAELVEYTDGSPNDAKVTGRIYELCAPEIRIDAPDYRLRTEPRCKEKS